MKSEQLQVKVVRFFIKNLDMFKRVCYNTKDKSRNSEKNMLFVMFAYAYYYFYFTNRDVKVFCAASK